MKSFAFAAILGMALTAQASAAAVDMTTLTLNGDASAPTANDLNLVNGQGGEASSAFMAAIATPTAFSGSFDFTLVNAGYSPQADGLSFIIQADPNGASALGSGGGSIGADGIQNSVGIAFQSWSNDHATIFTPSTGGVYGGTQPLGNFSLGGYSTDSVVVSFKYENGVLSYTATNTPVGGPMETISDSYAIALSSLGPDVYIGFTGGSGLSYSNEDVSNFVFAVPEPSTWALMLLGFGALGFAGWRRSRLDVAA